ncbi:MAG: peroxidase [Chloroflexi bacterium]|nr:peroxidase [Chloroflexota bacterium]
MPGEAEAADAFVEQVAHDWREAAQLNAAERALCEFAERLSQEPSAMDEADVQELRAQGWSDRAIHDATQIIAYFNYINRVAEALGVELEDFVRPWGERPNDS